jgi:diguanylate cyclase (GGDEF)-like protein
MDPLPANLSWSDRVADRARGRLMGWGHNRLARGFATRLFLAILLTFTAVGTLGYIVMSRQLERIQIENYAKVHDADARSLEKIAVRHAPMRDRLREMREIVATVANRPGTHETLLIDQGNVVLATGTSRHPIGSRDSDRRVDAALRSGRRYAGREADPRSDTSNFEFVAPVKLGNGHLAFEVSYDDHFLDSTLGTLRQTLGIIGFLALLIGGGVFYFAGGRSLMRSHRVALQRATRDGLTDLPNHRAFQEELPRIVTAAARYGEAVSLLTIDVDDFKFLNDRHGHPFGDALLMDLAEILRGVRAEDRAYRIGGDEFAVLLPRSDADAARLVARRLSGDMHGAATTVTIGLSTMGHSNSAEELRAEADAALYEAKRHGGGATAHFDDIRGDVVISTSAKSEAVRRLLDEGAMSTVFQPIWDLGSGELIGIEALTRPDARYGFAGPAEAFDLAEQIGRVHELDVLCVNHTLSMSAELPDDALLFINLSPQTIDLDAKGNHWLKAAVERSGLPCDRIVIEVTERFGARTSSVIKSLQNLRLQGFKLALDDVGTGNSGLEMLRRVGAEFVKIDRGIVNAATVDPNARAVLMAMATYASQTGSFVIAEGIEDETTLDFLLTIEDHEDRPQRLIHGGQGYGLGRPAEHVETHTPDLLTGSPARRHPAVTAAA